MGYVGVNMEVLVDCRNTVFAKGLTSLEELWWWCFGRHGFLTQCTLKRRLILSKGTCRQLSITNRPFSLYISWRVLPRHYIAYTALEKHRRRSIMGASSILSIFEGAKSFYIPPHSSYHVDLNPAYDAKLDAEIDKWCMDFLNLHDLTDHKTQFAIQSKLGKLAGFAYQAISSERLSPIAKFFCWLFLADDFMDDPSVPVSDLKNATLAYKLIFKNDYDQAITLVESKGLLRQMGMLNDVYTDLKGFMNPGHKTRFSKSMIDVLDMFEVESSWLHKTLVPNFEIYMWMREVTAGVIPCMVAMDFLNNFGLEEEGVLDDPHIQTLEVIANRHSFLANDMVSFKKEWACEQYLNSVALVGYSSNCGLNEAMEKVAQMVQDLEKEFADIKQKVLSNKDLNKGNVMGYVQSLEYFMAANIEFSWISARYHGVGWVSPAEKYGTFEF
ncbi:hypothetical protein SELMODRAFT_429799 [Selaginella moellendorffii]|uniref:Terpene synthase n=2 Tax=Selaginella moellendorffii TaxID=88036 RepID=D8T7C3_SELML|nr:hypothetical protein SELMODRAFT_429799 [Selaginella moellendorffii]